MGTICTFPGGKEAGHEADHSLTSSAKVKNGGTMPPLPHTSSYLNHSSVDNSVSYF
jgi:hypothetical protein